MSKDKPEPVWKGDKMTTKETLEGLKVSLKEENRNLRVLKNEWNSESRLKDIVRLDIIISENRIKTFSTAIGWGEKLKEADKVLPEKLIYEPNACATDNQNLHTHGYRVGSNDMHDIARPVIAKLLIKIKELEK